AEARRIRLHLDAEPACAQADAVHLARAVDNLLDNAMRHAPEGSVVELRMRRTERGTLTIRVDDDGPGVPDALQGHLFEPFATGRPDGTGLGLALAREVALAHGGDLSYIVPSKGGARFEMEFPWRAC
ncbi:MAG TPA: ATP-binding protein, partial [Burkholderiaceae bacterium]|nr:ATP-binding protein [Burkholderiaceae bacterium]